MTHVPEGRLSGTEPSSQLLSSRPHALLWGRRDSSGVKPDRKIPLSEEDQLVFAPPGSKVAEANVPECPYPNVPDGPLVLSLQEVTHLHH